MKRQFLAIPLLIIALYFLLSPSKAYALSCCPDGTAISPSGTGCTVRGALIPFQCAEPEPLCEKTTNTCVSADSDLCGAHGQKCCGTVCDDDLICALPGDFSEACMTEEEINTLFPGAVISTAPKFDPFCIEGDKESGINTALGCIKVGTGDDLIKTILQLATGLGGGLALALILYGVFIVTTSAGMPDKLKAGSEIITSAIVGLVFILLSIFLVNLIGINILGIPGLS